MHIVTCLDRMAQGEMAAIRERFEFPSGALQVIILLSEIKAAVLTCVCME